MNAVQVKDSVHLHGKTEQICRKSEIGKCSFAFQNKHKIQLAHLENKSAPASKQNLEVTSLQYK
jgi:hypothetical protein